MKKKRTDLKDLEVMALDCQATHSNPHKGHILEIGWVKTRATKVSGGDTISKDVETFLLKVPKYVEIPRAVLRITKIPEEELESAHSPEKIWHHFLQAVEQTAISPSQQVLEGESGTTCPAVIHFVRYEEPFLRKLHREYDPGLEFPLSIVCTHEMVKRLLPGLPRKSLRAVAGYFGHSLSESRRCSHHVAATAVIWSHLVKLLDIKHSIHTFDELQDWLKQPILHSSDNRKVREYPMDETFRKDLPNLPGVYRMYRSGGDILYIGKAKSLKQRINSYFQKKSRHPEHILEMLSQAQSLDTTVTFSAVEAALIELDEIKRFSPPYNRALQMNEREVLFFSKDLKSSYHQPDSDHSIGPLPSSSNLDSLACLGDVLNGDLRKISRKVIQKICDIPLEYLPDRSCFVGGVKAFQAEIKESIHSAFDLTTWMSLGAQFWKDKMEEQALQAAAKKEAKEAASKKRSLKENISGESESKETLELKMQDSEAKTIEETWTPERVVKVLKSIIRLGAFQIRRARWFCRISESTLVWTPLGGDADEQNQIVFKSGIPDFKDRKSPCETISLPPGHKRTLNEWQRHFDLFVFDRMRVVTTEIRRLIQEGRTVEICLHPDVSLRNDQLKRMLQWL